MKYFIVIFLSTLMFCHYSCAQTNGSPVTNKVSASMQSADAILPTPYRVKLNFPEPLPMTAINRRMFSIKEKTNGEPLEITAIHRAGAVESNAPVDVTGSVYIYAKFDPDLVYTIDVSQPNKKLITVEVPPFNKPSATSSNIPPLLNLDAKFFHLQIVPFVATSGNTGGGLQYDAKYSLKNLMVNSGLLQFNFQSQGKFSLVGSSATSNSIPNSLNAGLNATYLYDVPLSLQLGNDVRQYVYPIGVKIAPAQFELNKQFSLVNYTTKLLVGGALPYADYPALLWSKWFHLDVPFTAPTVFTGYGYLENVKNDGSDPLAKLGHQRWDTEFLYDLPLQNQVDFHFAWRSYVGLDKRNWNNDIEIGALVYVDQKRTQGVSIVYEEGALPPMFVRTHTWKFGYSAKF